MSKDKFVLVLGDSHANVFRNKIWEDAATGIRWKVVQSHGGTLSGLSNPRAKTNTSRQFDEALAGEQPDAIVTILGEVDCGYVIFYYADRDKIDVRQAAQKALDNYKALLRKCVQTAPVLVLSTPLPTIPDGAVVGDVARRRAAVQATQRERTELTLWFNEQLKRFCTEQRIAYVDMDAESLGPDGLVAKHLLRANLADHHYRFPAYKAMLMKNMLPKLTTLLSAPARRLAGPSEPHADTGKARSLKELVLAKPDWASDFAFLLPALEQPPGVKSGVTVTDEQFAKLFATARGSSESVAAATIVRRFCERSRRKVFESAAGVLESAPLEIPPAGSERPDEVTILSAVLDGPQLKAVFAAAAALLASPDCKRLHLLFTNEWNWGAWRQHGNRKLTETLHAAFREQIAHFAAAPRILADLDRRLNLLVHPSPEQVAQSLGSVVIRYEGAAHFKTTYLHGEAIHAARPVVTATFSSVVVSGRNTDLTLTRTSGLEAHQRYYIPPAQISQAMRLPVPGQYESATLVTAYTQERIKMGLSKLTRRDWDEVAAFFGRWPKAKWLLVGAANVDEARLQIPPDIRESCSDNIEVLGFSDLGSLFDGALALLTFPAAFGGGVTATTAIAMGVPVLVNTDPRSDVSNALPPSLHVRDFVDAFATADSWLRDRQAWSSYVAAQQESLQARMDLAAKGDELLGILSDALALRVPA